MFKGLAQHLSWVIYSPVSDGIQEGKQRHWTQADSQALNLYLVPAAKKYKAVKIKTNLQAQRYPINLSTV